MSLCREADPESPSCLVSARRKPFLHYYYFISLHVQAVLLTELADLAGLGGTFTPGSLPSLSLQLRQHLAVLAEPPALVVLSH